MDPTHDPRLLDRPQSASDHFTRDELDSASRNHAFYLELLALETTPIGAHYVVLHFDIPLVDASTWRLEIGGLVTRPLTLTLEDVRQRPRVEAPVTLECAGNGRALMTPRPVTMPWFVEGVSTARWAGVSLRDLLIEAGVDTVGGRQVVFGARDRGITKGIDHHYQRALPLDQALLPDVVLAYEMEHRPLPPQHGFPLRLVVPGWYGMASVKWLDRVTVIDREFEGYQQKYVYRDTQCAEDLGQPVTRMNVRSLFRPPGLPDGDSRRRYAPPGRYEIVGKAWSGVAPVTGVEFSADGGRTWRETRLLPPTAPQAWQTWTATWEATPGTHVLCSRATDAGGNTQPVTAVWNLQGMGNNSVYRLEVTVADRLSR
ncbi:MAG: sulfite oxidase [Candidatus Rokuibacteriota bacterium]|nr:MAG: sulfite oxidase [Candidatus Rokubacteria bacterium]